MACLFQKIVSFDKESYFCIETINIKLSFHSMNFVEELKWRGMVHTMMPGTEELFEKGIVTAYLGIDPTADSLHIGHLCGVMMLRHFQRCGHKPIALLGGATGMIGDPSGKSQERNLLDENTLRHNQECIKKQLSKFLDFDSDAPNHAELVNNYDWMKDFSFLDFARTVGKHITVNYMMAKDSVQKRLNGEARDGLSFTEFTYQLLQGYDFLHLYETKNCKLQLGGSDQWGNITTGAELIRPHLPARDQSRRNEIRENRIGQRMVGCPLHLSLQILSVLAERERRGCQTLHQNLHIDLQRRNRGSECRARRSSALARVAKTSGQRGYRNGTLRSRLRSRCRSL